MHFYIFSVCGFQSVVLGNISVCHRPPQGISYYPPFPRIYTILEKPLIDFYLVFGKPVSSQIPFRIIYYNEIAFIISYALSQED